MPDIVADKRYRELVRLAYLILPGEGSREFRLALAQRIVDRNLPRRPVGGRSFAEARERVLRQAMRPPRRLRVRLFPWARGLPSTVPGNAALAALSPEERLAYVLRRVTGLRHYVVRDLMVDFGIHRAQEILDAVEAMDDLNVVAPATVSRRGLLGRARVPLAVAAALTCGLLGGLAVENRTHSVASAGATAAVNRSLPVNEASVRKPAAVHPAPRRPTAAMTPPPPVEATFWSGALPAQGGTARLACRRTTLPDGSTRQTGVFVWRNARLAARDCADGMTGVWWKAPSGRWYYLAAAGPHLAMRLSGAVAERRGSLLLVRSGRGPVAPRLPIVLRAG